MKNKILFLTLLHLIFLGSFIINAQHLHHYDEVIHLKNGTIIKGVIIEQVPGQFIKVRTKDGQEAIYQSSEVASITKDFFEFKKKGYINITEIGVAVGPDNVAYSISTVNGYLIKPHFSLGVGAGYDYYVNTGSMVPLYLDMRIILHDKRFTPFIYNDAGYSFAISSATLSGFKAGIMFNPGFGIKTFVGKTTAFVLSFGIKIQNIKYNIPDPSGTTTNLISSSSFSQLFMVKAGFRF
jgi:hypothetical protein